MEYRSENALGIPETPWTPHYTPPPTVAESERFGDLGPLPPEPAARKRVPIATGFMDYFPDAIAAIAECSQITNEQHNPGTPVHWDRSKSPDEADCLMRHFLDRGKVDTDGVRHSAKLAWRALALLQKEIEASRNLKGK